jgi:hypothetical protein
LGNKNPLEKQPITGLFPNLNHKQHPNRLAQKQKISSGIQKRFSVVAHWHVCQLISLCSRLMRNRVGFGTLHFPLTGPKRTMLRSVGCQGFIGPIPSTFLDRIAFKRTAAKIMAQNAIHQIKFQIQLSTQANTAHLFCAYFKSQNYTSSWERLGISFFRVFSQKNILEFCDFCLLTSALRMTEGLSSLVLIFEIGQAS